jgi:hypothetical protein
MGIHAAMTQQQWSGINVVSDLMFFAKKCGRTALEGSILNLA